MIDVLTSDLIEVRKIASETFGNRIAPNTAYRWASKGAGGVRLEAVKIGRKWFTTPEAFREFCEAQTQAAMKAAPATRKPSADGIPADVSRDELDACGLL